MCRRVIGERPSASIDPVQCSGPHGRVPGTVPAPQLWQGEHGYRMGTTRSVNCPLPAAKTPCRAGQITAQSRARIARPSPTANLFHGGSEPGVSW